MYKRNEKSWLKHLDFAILDILILQVAYVIAYMIRHGWVVPYRVPIYSRLAAIIVILDVIVVLFSECYSGILKRNKFQELRAAVVHVTIVFFGVLAYIFLAQLGEDYSRQTLYSYWAISAVLVYGFRCILKRIIRRRILSEKTKTELVIVSQSANAAECVRGLAKSKYTEYRVSGLCILDKDMRGEEIEGVPVLACADDFMEFVRSSVVDEVFLDTDRCEDSDLLASELVEYGLTVHTNLAKIASLSNSRIIEPCGSYMVMTSSLRIASSRQLFIKRVMDILGSLVGMVLAIVAFIIFAPIIKIQSPGPVFFTQTRIGQGGRPFKFYKFRSMYVDAEKRKAELLAKNEMQGLMFKMKDDPRVTPIGRFIRKYSIDELPQFWNVLKGDMSLVGTRPPTLEEFADYELHHKARLSIKPGLTGMWQVSGRSDITDFEEVVALDTDYIANWSLGLDARILFRTIKVVFTGNGSK